MSTGKSAAMPPPPTLASPPMQRPGIREITDGHKMERPGIVQRSGTPSKMDEMAHPDNEEKVVEQTPQQQQTARVLDRAPVDIPPHGGRVPRCGDHVIYWQRDLSNRIIEYPAQLIWWNSVNRRWALNLHQVGRVQGRHEIHFSETPADCCWTWPESKVAGGDALATAESAFEMCANLAQEIATLKDKMAAMQHELAEVRSDLNSLRPVLLNTDAVKDQLPTKGTVATEPVRLPPDGKASVTPSRNQPKGGLTVTAKETEVVKHTDGSL